MDYCSIGVRKVHRWRCSSASGGNQLNTSREVCTMSVLSRWAPIREATSLRDAMNQLFEQAVMRPNFLATASGYSTFGQMNVLESDGQYLVQVLLPGINPDKVDLTVRQN